MNFDEELRKLKRAEKYRNVGLWLFATGFFLLGISVLANLFGY